MTNKWYYFTGYIQEVGRAGRDGHQSEAILHFNNEDLARSNCRAEVRQYCELKSCRRDFITQHFGTKSDFCGDKHNCCDYCGQECDCGSCSDPPTEIQEETLLAYDEITASTILEILLQLFDIVNSGIQSAVDPALITGLTRELAKDIAENYHLMMDFDEMLANYFYIKREYIEMCHDTIMQYHFV